MVGPRRKELRSGGVEPRPTGSGGGEGDSGLAEPEAGGVAPSRAKLLGGRGGPVCMMSSADGKRPKHAMP